MEFIIRKDICKEFLDKYNKDIYPELLSRIIEIGILTLKLGFKKLTFGPNKWKGKNKIKIKWRKNQLKNQKKYQIKN